MVDTTQLRVLAERPPSFRRAVISDRYKTVPFRWQDADAWSVDVAVVRSYIDETAAEPKMQCSVTGASGIAYLIMCFSVIS
jgi:hypothetical protein